MNELQRKHALEWADRLERLPSHINFGMIDWFDTDAAPTSSPVKAIDCGTAACAAGLLPYFFPDEWHFHWDKNNYVFPRLKDSPHDNDTLDDLSMWTGIGASGVDRIVFPSSYFIEPNDITPENVAACIRQEVKDAS